MSVIVVIASSDLITNSRADINANFAALNADKIETSYLDTDTTLAANSDSRIATQKAVKAYIDSGGNSIASTTAKGIVQQATDAQVLARTTTGSSGAPLFVNPSSLSSVLKFGGTGADGALAITSGTTTIDLGGARVFTKNYTSISITGTAKLVFTNPHASGTVIVLKSQGNVTITSSGTPAISVVGMGAAGGTKGTNGVIATVGTSGSVVQPMVVSGLAGGGLGVASASGGAAGAGGAVASPTISTAFGTLSRFLPFLIGAGGGGGGYGSNSSEGGAGGRGGGCLFIQCAGAYSCSSTLSAAGAAGSDAITGGTPNQGAGGGGGGGGGSIIVLYNTLTSDTGTYTVSGGAAGAGVSGSGSGTGGGGAGGGGSNTAGTIGTAGNGSGVGGAGGAGGAGLSLIALNTELA